ncbi:MAG: hypothetical protein MI922_04810 [Bacteroidales bacterium]|nr:hypothetical protein [Bacteroidales bacterium]
MKTHLKKYIIVMVFVISAPTGFTQEIDSAKQQVTIHTSEIIKDNILSFKGTKVELNGVYLDASPMVFSFYESTNFQPQWFQEQNKELTLQLIRFLSNSYFLGIDQDIFNTEYLSFLYKKANTLTKPAKIAKKQAEFELLFTNTLFQFLIINENGTEYYEEADFMSNMEYIQKMTHQLQQAVLANNLIEEIMRYCEEHEDFNNLIIDLNFLVFMYHINNENIDVNTVSSTNIEELLQNRLQELPSAMKQVITENVTEKFKNLPADYFTQKSGSKHIAEMDLSNSIQAKAAEIEKYKKEKLLEDCIGMR